MGACRETSGTMSASLHDGHGPDRQKIAPPRVEEISDDVFAYVQPDGTWWINNTGFLVGEHGVVSIDACSTHRRTAAYIESIRAITDQPIRTLVNTHHHGDHTFGNYLFREATIVGHERVRTEMIESGGPPSGRIWTDVDWGEIEVTPPFLTYTDQVGLWVDDLYCAVRHVGGPAHTTNDSIVWIPSRRVLFSGDLVFNGGTPFLLMGSVAGAIDVVEKLKGLGATTVVPGHGDVCGPEGFDVVLEYLRFVMAAAERGRTAGLSPLEAARHLDLGGWAELSDAERIVGNLHRAYADLAGAPLGCSIDVQAALVDMVEYNDGDPLSCYA